MGNNFVITNTNWPNLTLRVIGNGLYAVDQTVTIRNGAVMINTSDLGIDRIDELTDVVEPPSPAAGSTLVYDPDTDKYDVERLNLANIDGSLDGGTF